MIKSEKIDFIRKALPTLKINDIKENKRGWDNDIIIINNLFVFRFPKDDNISKKIKVETELLRLLKEKNPLLALPAYTLLYDENEKFFCTYHKYIGGIPLNTSQNLIKTDESAKLLGDFLSKLHSIPVSDLDKIGLTTTHTDHYWNDFYSSIKEEIFPNLSTSQKKMIEQLFNHFFTTFSSEKINKCVIHGDLTSANIIYDPTRAQLSGIIDFTDAQISDPAFDFAGFYWDFGPEFSKMVLSHYSGPEPIEAIFSRVSSFYGLQPIFHELLYSIRNGSKVDTHVAMSKLFKLQESAQKW